MIDIVINYDTDKKMYKVYEPTSDTLLVSSNLSESLVNLSKFLLTSKLTNSDILGASNISYHIDSFTMKSIIESNVSLIKRLNSAPSGFTVSNQKFGGSASTNQSQRKKSNKDNNTGFGKKKSGFSGASGFKSAGKKFGSKY